MFLRAVYSLGESADSSTVVFRTTSPAVDASNVLDDSHNSHQPPDDSSKPGCRGDGNSAPSFPVLSVNCPVSETGDGGSGSFPARQLSQVTDVQQGSTYLLGAGKTPKQAVKVTDQPSLDSLLPDAVLATGVEEENFRSSAAYDSTAAESREEQKFLPKPPDESAFPRRNSFTRHGSLRRRADSESTQHTETKFSDETDACSEPVSVANLVSVENSLVAKTDNLTAKNATPMSGNRPSAYQVQSSPESSHKASQATQSSSKSSPEDLARCRSQDPTRSAERRRSSSLGAVRRRSHGTNDRSVTADKPPVGRRDSSMDRCSPAYTEDNPSRKHPEKVDVKSASKTSPPSSRILLPKQGNASSDNTKKLFGHKR